MTIGDRAAAFWDECRGATAVEFAFIAVPLMLLLVGVVEVGRLMWTAHALDEVAIASARCMGIRAQECGTDEGVIPEHVANFAKAAARSWGVVLATQDISLSSEIGCAVDTGFLRIGIATRFDSILPGLGGLQIATEACFPSQFPEDET